MDDANLYSYYVMATRESDNAPTWRWRIMRRGDLMGVEFEAGGFCSYEMARLAGRVVLEHLMKDVSRI